SLMCVFAVLLLPRPRTLRLVCLTNNEFQASISYAFAGDAVVWLTAGASGFRIVRSRGLDVAMFRDATFAPPFGRRSRRVPSLRTPGFRRRELRRSAKVDEATIKCAVV